MAVTMIVNLGGYVELAGSSNDAKPTDVSGGSLFMETDTGSIYTFDAASTSWTKLGG